MALVALLGLSSLASRPTIGIYPTLTADNYLHAYQEWLDAAGADSVIFDKAWPSEKTERLFQSVNGFLIPGGGNIDAHSSVDEMVARAVKGNLVGDYFPMWGTCLGFEWLVSIFGGYCGGDTCMSAGFDAEDLPLPLTFTDAAASSRLYAATNKTEMHWLASEAITYNAHSKGIGPKDFAANAGLAANLTVLATGADRNGREFVAQVEAKSLPIYANQFHPEKIEWVHSPQDPHIPRSAPAVAGARSLASFFASEARKNKHGAAAV